jgi:hypothetical protein
MPCPYGKTYAQPVAAIEVDGPLAAFSSRLRQAQLSARPL